MRFSHSTKTSFLTLTSATLCLGALYNDFTELPTKHYDFVIIGGGAGGNVIANRLTQNTNFSVLVLEAGGSNEGVIESMVPFFNVFLRSQSPYDWNYTTIKQVGLNGRTLSYPRGYILGGCTSTNGMDYVRGSSEDWDRYARFTGDSGWSWGSLQPHIRKNEKWTPPADHHNTTGQFDPAVHGFHGINSVSLAGFPRAIDARVTQTTQELSDEFPFNLDFNSGSQLGIGWGQATVKDGQRSSSATSYLGPEFIKRPNLHVLVNARVTQIIQTSSASVGPAFRTVEFVHDIRGPMIRVTASKEVILSAGSIGTPHILMNSGIGDENELNQLRIQTLVHLPDVGKNLSVHIGLGTSYLVNSTDTYDDIIRNSTLRAELLHLWNQTHTGPLVDSIGGHSSFLRLPNNASIFETHPDPAAGPHTGHFSVGAQNGMISNQPPTGHFLTIGSTLYTPTSRGSIRLDTTNPFDQPLIDLGCLTTDFDILALREGVKTGQRFLTAPAWKDYVLNPVSGIANATTDAALEEFIRANANPNGHVVGTASMSPKGATYGVVDPDLRVKGVSGLRIIDASIFPFVTAGNTQVPVYMVAERAADLIKAAWK